MTAESGFLEGPIQGVRIGPLQRFTDERGWLAEVFRNDSLPEGHIPLMAYISLTLPGVLRGPHEHEDQADMFCMVGPGDFKLTLWDNRPGSSTYRNRTEVWMGDNNPGMAIIPKGVVHCYRCISAEPGIVVNCPDRLFKGEGKAGPVDEIRHEDDPESPFVKDELERRANLP